MSLCSKFSIILLFCSVVYFCLLCLHFKEKMEEKNYDEEEEEKKEKKKKEEEKEKKKRKRKKKRKKIKMIS